MSRLTDTLLGMDEKLSRAFLERGILNLPASVTPRRPWRIALPMVVLAVVAALAVGLSLRRPAVAPARTHTPVSALEPAPAPSRQPFKADELFRAVMDQGLQAARGGAFEEARGLFERALEVNAASAEGWNNLGVVLIRQGDEAAGLAAFRRALGLKPTHAEAHRNLAVALERRGESLDAARHYLFFLSLSQDVHPDRAEIRRRVGAAGPGSDE